MIADTPAVTMKTVPTDLTTHINNSYSGELGLPSSYAASWNSLLRVDLEGDIMKRPQPDAAEILGFTGPAWLRPSNEFLPRSTTK